MDMCSTFEVAVVCGVYQVIIDRTIMGPEYNWTVMLFQNWFIISPVPKDRGMLWFYVKAARRPQWC